MVSTSAAQFLTQCIQLLAQGEKVAGKDAFVPLYELELLGDEPDIAVQCLDVVHNAYDNL
ncbi:MAG: hypothetical protein PWQ11_583 [Candidatus Diapherotrites archaeon]|nr:hypothetical protein [Candidatus Diapherotrites archaeon]